jgi:hypothetical protein
LTQSSQSVIVNERGSVRFRMCSGSTPAFAPIKLQNDAGAAVDFYNLSNESAVQLRHRAWFGIQRPSDVQRGRLIKFGMSLEF